MRTFGVAAAVLVMVLGTAALGQQAPSGGTVAVMGSDGIQRAEISGGDYYFAPGIITVKVNVPVELTVKKMPGHKPHKITMRSPEAGMAFTVALRAEPGTIKFTPTKAGDYPFWCPERAPLGKSHKARGMTGTIRVIE